MLTPLTTGSGASLRLRLRNGGQLGPGKIELLEHLARERSISGAARAMGMAYRKAWLMIDDLNQTFSEPVVRTFPGRSQGAGAELTAFGERLIALFRAAERRMNEAVALQLAELDDALNPQRGGSEGAPLQRSDAG
jgi:molybdate transport system regulatory protein